MTDTLPVRKKMFTDALLKWGSEYTVLRSMDRTHFSCVRMENFTALSRAAESQMEKVHRRIQSLPEFLYLEDFSVEELSTYLWLLEENNFEEASKHLTKVKGRYETLRNDSR